jgi:hypothetical protein
MTANDRREFLRTLAKSAAYAAPVMVSVAAPAALAQGGEIVTAQEAREQQPAAGPGDIRSTGWPATLESAPARYTASIAGFPNAQRGTGRRATPF